VLSSKLNFLFNANCYVRQKIWISQLNKMSLELTGLVEDFIETKLLSKIELDFLESELWETLEHIDEITSLTSAPTNISKKLKLKDGSSWQLCCAVILDTTRPNKSSRKESLQKLIEKYRIL